MVSDKRDRLIAVMREENAVLKRLNDVREQQVAELERKYADLSRENILREKMITLLESENILVKEAHPLFEEEHLRDEQALAEEREKSQYLEPPASNTPTWSVSPA